MDAPPGDVPALAPDVGPPDWEPELDDVERALDDVERALLRLDEGTYGSCEICGAPIDDEVLASEPTARRCADHR